MKTRFIVSGVIAVLILAGVIVLRGQWSVAGDEGASPPNPIEEQLKKGGPKEWEAALADNNSQRQAIIKFLMERVKDEKEKAQDRLLAATLLGRTKTKEAAEFLLQNIDIGVDIRDGLQATPCSYALEIEASWEKIPAFIEYLKAERSTKELLYPTAAMSVVPGYAVMLGILEQQYASPRVKGAHRKNMRFVMDLMISSLEASALTPAQLERQKMMQEEKLKPGQLPEEGDKKPPEKDKPESCPSSPTPMEPDDKPANP
jgi:hypothetical protein